MNAVALLLALLSAEPKPEWTSPPGEPEYGHGLTAEQAADGWISLFDGKTAFGWVDSTVADGTIAGGRTTCPFGTARFIADVAEAGSIGAVSLPSGRNEFAIIVEQPQVVALDSRIKLRSLIVKPSLEQTFEAARFTIVKHPRLPDEKQTRWTLAGKAIRGVGGPGCVELKDSLFGDFAMQLTVNARGPLTNGGIFFRAIPGDFMNGYEAQVFNSCEERDPARPTRWSTGAIDDRQNARRVVSRDGRPFTYTIVAVGRHIGVWSNGFQQIDWTDDRPEDDNARKGRRTKPGAIQLQAHDELTDIEFSNLRIQGFSTMPE